MSIAVLGLGNVLMGDDALGPHVIARLRAGYAEPDGVAFEDLGTPGLDLHPHLAGNEVIILVDIVKSAGEPGELRLYRKDEVLRHAPGPRTSPHDPGVKEALLALDFAGDGPRELLLVGVIPDRIPHLEVGLSDAVRDAVPRAVEAVLAELDRLGRPAQPLPEPGEPDLWWERRPGKDPA